MIVELLAVITDFSGVFFLTQHNNGRANSLPVTLNLKGTYCFIHIFFDLNICH